MPDVKALGDIDGGVVNAYRPALALTGGTVARSLCQNPSQNLAHVEGLVHEKVEIAAGHLNMIDEWGKPPFSASSWAMRGGAFRRCLAKAKQGRA